MYNLVAHKIIMFGIFRDVRTGEESQKYVGGLFSLFFSLGKKNTKSSRNKNSWGLFILAVT